MDNDTASPRPDEPDIHLSVLLRGTHLDYAACETAALEFVRDWQTTRYFDDAQAVDRRTNGLPRLPNERLYLYF
ncbi:hypothetical protein [Nocardia salmonicida]|uniref:hypothetical protein n=1 Tax=Nocardia salmonicida TaxID=53431 RepID=UPI003CE78147